MKVILVVILAAIALYLYRRTQAVAKQERDKTDRNAPPHSSSIEVAQPETLAATDDTIITEPEHATVSKPVEDNGLADSVIDAPELVSAGSIDEPIETAKTTAAVSPSDSQQADITVESEAAANETEAMVAVSKADIEIKAADTPAVDVSISTQPGQQLNLDRVEGDWASESFLQQVDAANNASELPSQHDDLVSVINHCYKMRKQANYCQYGAALQLTYLGLYRALHQQYVTQKSTDDIKLPAFMQLSTLLNDIGQFDAAVKVCQQALKYQLTDGTVTGFEGRIKRIEKAKAKAS
jgi:hypothetical protein